MEVAGTAHRLEPGGFAFVPPGAELAPARRGHAAARFHWIRKAYEPVEGLGLPEVIVGNERDVTNTPMPDTDGRWTTTRFFDHDDMRHGHACDHREPDARRARSPSPRPT